MDFDNIDMALIDTNEENSPVHEQEQNTIEIPPTVDPERPPIRNDDNATCHCGNCACPCARPATVEGIGDSGPPVASEPGEEGLPSKTTSEAGDDDVDGEQGAEEHLIEIGDLGLSSRSLIRRTLAKHARCICHCGILPDASEYPYDSPGLSSPASSGDSMIVGLSGDGSMTSSIFGLGLRSHGSAIFNNMNGGFEPDALWRALPLLFNPLQLTPEYPMELSISTLSTISDRDFPVPVDDFHENDFW